MFYKLTNGDIVVDALRETRYVRYIPRSKRWINTDEYSANGIMAGNGSTIYHLIGRNCNCPDILTKVRVEEITEEEYNTLIKTLSGSQAENQKLQNEIDELKAQLEAQNALLQQILAKL